jgi:hypothetical protein
MVLLGVRTCAARFRATQPDRVLVLAAAVIGAFGIISSARTAIRVNGCRTEAAYQAAACFRPEQRDFARAVTFVRDSLPPGAVIHTSKPSTVFALSGRQTLPPWGVFGADGIERFRRGELGTHLLLSRFIIEEHRASGGSLARGCRDLVAVAAFPRAVLLAPRPPSGDGADACPHIARLAAEPKPG